MELIKDDSLIYLRTINENSIDSLVTDPPAFISFMGKEWDGFDKLNHISDIFKECYRVLKPGAYGVVWALPRTSHHTAKALEDSGFEIRDIIHHVQGQGFPKSLNIEKTLEKQNRLCQCERHENTLPNMQKEITPSEKTMLLPKMLCPVEVEQQRNYSPPKEDSEQRESRMVGRDKGELHTEYVGGKEQRLEGREIYRASEGICNDSEFLASQSEAERICPGTYSGNGEAFGEKPTPRGRDTSLRPQSPKQLDRKPRASRKSSRALGEISQSGLHCCQCSKVKKEKVKGFHTALKPAVEHWILIRKPLSEKTVVDNVEKWGTGGLNIDGCRVDTKEIKKESSISSTLGIWGNSKNIPRMTGNGTANNLGRFPANLVHDGSEEVEREFLEQGGVRKTGEFSGLGGKNKIFGALSFERSPFFYKRDEGSASRFFNSLPDDIDTTFIYQPKASTSERNEGLDKFPDSECGIGDERPSGQSMVRLDGREPRITKNFHPTVKSIALMSHLIKLTTPPNGICLDPFMGSGSTGVACVKNGFDFIGIEQHPEYFEIAKARISHASA